LQAGLLRRSKELGINSAGVGLGRASALGLSPIAFSTLAFSRDLPAVRCSTAVAVPAIVSLSTLVHDILLVAPRLTTRERPISGDSIATV
jgi:hypothetical protein